MASRRQLRVQPQQGKAPGDREPFPPRLLWFNVADWAREVGPVEMPHNMSGDEAANFRAVIGQGRARQRWRAAQRAWTAENGYTMRELFDAIRLDAQRRREEREASRPESR